MITLKALTDRTTGAVIAAPTTSLPEDLGGSRNWDYRYCWLRDSALTLDALLDGGYVEEALAFGRWALRAAAGDPSKLQIMYGTEGQRNLQELELDWLPGYEGSRPVRVGNAAAEQFQLDVYGEVRRGGGLCHEHRHRPDGCAALAAGARADRVPRASVARARRRHLGAARSAPPLRALKGDGLGCVRLRDPAGGELRAASSVGALAADPRPDTP